jgi:hypothetical protein
LNFEIAALTDGVAGDKSLSDFSSSGAIRGRLRGPRHSTGAMMMAWHSFWEATILRMEAQPGARPKIRPIFGIENSPEARQGTLVEEFAIHSISRDIRATNSGKWAFSEHW